MTDEKTQFKWLAGVTVLKSGDIYTYSGDDLDLDEVQEKIVEVEKIIDELKEENVELRKIIHDCRHTLWFKLGRLLRVVQ